MTHQFVMEPVNREEEMVIAHQSLWAVRAMLLWKHRRMLVRVIGISLLVGLGISFSIPKEYRSQTSIMPPEQQGSSAMMLAALSSRSSGLGALGSLAGGLLGGRTS